MIPAQATEIAAEVAKQLKDASSVQEVLVVIVCVLLVAVLALFGLCIKLLKGAIKREQEVTTKVEELKDQILDVVVELNENLAASQEE